MDPEIVDMVQFLDPEIVEKIYKSYIKYQPSGAGGTRSPPATPHRPPS